MVYRTAIALLISVNCFAQQDSIQIIELMEVTYIPVLKVNSNELKSKEIQEMALVCVAFLQIKHLF